MTGMDRYFHLFVQESRELLASFSEALRSLADGDVSALKELFRHAHSVKGMAASLGLGEVESLSHALEDLLEGLRAADSAPDEDCMDLLWRGGDALADAVEQLAAGEEGPSLRPLAEEIRREAAAGGRAERSRAAPAPETRAADGGPEPLDAAEAAAVHEPVLEVTLVIDESEKMPQARAAVALRRLARLGRLLEGGPDETAGGRVIRRRLATSRGVSEVTPALEGIPGIARVEVGDAAGAPAVHPSARPGDSVRVPAEQMDLLLEETTEILVHQSRLARLAEGSGEAEAGIVLQRLKGTAAGLLNRLLELRMLPFQSILPALERSVRDLGRKLGKSAALRVEGAEVCLDRAILEHLVDPLTHLMRNALDHGIEDPETRVAAGKEPTGTVRVRLERASDTVLLVLEDDGAGMDPSALRRKAVEAGVVEEEAAGDLSESDALLLATVPGVSTARARTEISGRGVGLDAVRERIEALGGDIHLMSEAGRGTRVALRLPPTVAVLSAFIVRAGGEDYAVPVRKVEETVPIRGNLVAWTDGRPRISWRGEAVDVYGLGPALDGGAGVLPEDGVALVHFRRGRPAAALADEVQGRRDLLIKPLLGPLEAMGELTGAAVTGDGRVIPVLDLDNVGPPDLPAVLRRTA